MAHLEAFAQVGSVLTYLFVRSGTSAFQMPLSVSFSGLFCARYGCGSLVYLFLYTSLTLISVAQAFISFDTV